MRSIIGNIRCLQSNKNALQRAPWASESPTNWQQNAWRTYDAYLTIPFWPKHCAYWFVARYIEAWMTRVRPLFHNRNMNTHMPTQCPHKIYSYDLYFRIFSNLVGLFLRTCSLRVCRASDIPYQWSDRRKILDIEAKENGIWVLPYHYNSDRSENASSFLWIFDDRQLARRLVQL